MTLGRVLVVDDDRLLATRADPDAPELRAAQVLERLHVALGVLGEVGEAAAAGDVLAPAVEVLVDRLRVVELALRHRHLVVPHAVDVVGHADRHPVPARQHVELGQEQLGEAVDAGGVAGDHRVVPAAAAVAAGRDADLAADPPELLAVVVEQLGRERAGADAGGVGLDHADHPVDAGRADTGADADAAGHRVAARHERVGAVVDVEHGGLGALEQDGLALVQRLVEQQRGVADHRPQPLDVRQELLDDRLGLDGAAVVDLGQHLVLEVQRGLDLLGEDALVEEVGDPDAGAVDLVGVRRPDAAAGGADLVLAEEPLGHLVEGRVVAGDHVRVGADDQRRGVHAAGLERVDLAEERVGRDHDTVGDHRRAARREDAAGQQVGRELLAVDDDRVAGVVAAGRADAVVDVRPTTFTLGGEQVGRLALALVTPLGSEDHDCGHATPLR